MYSHSRIQLILVAVKASCRCCIVMVFNIKNVTLESIYNSIFSLSYIFDLALVAFQTINKIVTLTTAICNCIEGFVTAQIFNFPWLGDFSTILTSVWSIASFHESGSRLGNPCHNQHVLKGRWLPIGYHEVLLSQFPGGTRSA